MTKASKAIRGLYAITDSASLERDDYRSRIELALRGGVSLLQYRSKDPDRQRRTGQASTLVSLCAEYRVPLIINDDVALAASISAMGVHLGRDDAPVADARATLGPDAIIGVSCYDDLSRAIAAQAEGADYVAFGSFFPSSTKPHAVRAPLALLREARAHLTIPIVAIGGITPENGAALINAGADALAVIEGLFGQADIAAAARTYAALFREN